MIYETEINKHACLFSDLHNTDWDMEIDLKLFALIFRMWGGLNGNFQISCMRNITMNSTILISYGELVQQKGYTRKS